MKGKSRFQRTCVGGSDWVQVCDWNFQRSPIGLRLRVLPTRPLTDITNLAGMIKAPSHGAPHRLEDFDPASLLARGYDSAP